MIRALLLTALLFLCSAATIPPCNAIYLGLAPIPGDPAGTWHFEAIDTKGPWLLCYGTTLPGAHPWGTFKGCDFWPAPPVTLIGPLVGDLFTTFIPPASMTGMWQIIGQSPQDPKGIRTSNPVAQL